MFENVNCNLPIRNFLIFMALINKHHSQHRNLFMKKIITTASAILLLQSCATFDPYTGDSKTSKTAIGATAGASLAAVIA